MENGHGLFIGGLVLGLLLLLVLILIARISYKNKLVFLGGLMLAAGFAPLGLSLLSFVGFLPLLVALERTATKKQTIAVLYVFFFAFHGLGNWWVSSWQPNADPYLMASGIALWLGHPFFLMVPFVGYRIIRRKLGLGAAVWSLPFLWVAFEWLHSLSDASYPWLSLGYTQMHFLYIAQIADITGVWGVSFIVVLVNAIIAYWFFVYRGDVASTSPRLWKFAAVRCALWILPVLALPSWYGYSQATYYSGEHSITSSYITVGVIQPNINPWQKWENDSYQQVEIHQHIQDSLLATGPIDLLIWSETAIPYLGMNISSDHNFSFLQRGLTPTHTALLTGFSEIVTFPQSPNLPPMAKPLRGTNLYYAAHNSAILILPDTSKHEFPIHRKMRLTPFAEYIPFVDQFPFLVKWLEWGVGISNWMKGDIQRELPLSFTNTNKWGGGTAWIGCIICIESIYPDFVRNYSAQGANMLVVITNDAWYNHTFGPSQHYEIAAMRAIENRKAVARCANTGISGFIRPSGESYSVAPSYQACGLAQDIELLYYKTPYVQFGDWMPKLAFGFSLIVILFAAIRRKISRS
jgi:apolipoprotein N-acyltransferase